MASKFALVIANTEYQDASFAKLTAPGKDAEEFAQVLRELAAFDDVQVLLNEGEGKTRRSIARFFAERKRDDLLLLYFSGHGVRNEVGHLYLAANDTEINILAASGIPAEFVTQSMNNSRSQRQLLILDCCNSGAFAHGSKSASGVGKSMGIATAFEGSGFGRVVLTATDATQYAWEGDKVIGETQKSVFTHFLIEGLKGDADLDSDGRIDVDELYDYAYDQVVSRTPKQTPGKWSYKQQGDIILRENLKPREVKPAPLPPELLEMLAHPNSGVRRAGLQELIGLLDGKHQGLARAAREKLLEIAENDDSLTLRRSVSDALKARGFVLEEVIAQSDFYPFQQGPVPDSIETPKVEHKAQKHALTTEGRVEVLREKPASVLLNWKSIVSRFNLRVLLGIGALLVVVSLAVAAFPAPGVGSTKIGKDRATLVYVPAGEFTMGSDSQSDEQPIHKVTLDAFWIDKTEVTNAMYAKCMDAGRCKLPSDTTHYDDSNYANHPVVYVSWDQAIEYCAWAGRRLPTEAEWETAARGENASVYPWGNETPNNGLLNYNSAVGDTTEVGTYPDGASAYGALDMAGNVWEWVSSLYQSYPYDAKDGREDLSSSDARVLRGGSLYDLDYLVRSAYHGRVDPGNASYNLGFRCAMSATP
jgi:formylglycine-generating enzyme required for sulfatase activity